MSGKTRRRKLLFGTAIAAICGTLVLGMTSEAPLILYPITPSLPPGLYIRSFEPPTVGTIAAFRVPEAAKRYKASIGEDVHDDFLFMKPIVAGPGDHVCRRHSDGVYVNAVWTIPEIARDSKGRPLPTWSACRRLGDSEFFVASIKAPNSFDGRHFGPVPATRILGSYLRWRVLAVI